MYTAKIIDKHLDKTSRQFVLAVEFTDGADTFTESVRFGADFTFEAIKANLKQRLDSLNTGVAGEADIVVGDVDTDSVPDGKPTAGEIAGQEWLRNFSRLEKVQQLIDLGVLTGNEAPVSTLRNKVKDDFKATYINLF